MFFQNLRKVVFIGAHTDDEMVAAGTLRKLAKEGVDVRLLAISYAPIPSMSKEESIPIVRPEFLNSMKTIGIQDSHFSVLGYDPRTMPDNQSDIRQVIYNFSETEKPDLAIIPAGQDDHQDHSTLGKICEVVMKNRIPNIVRYHYPWNFINPGRCNLFVRLSEDEFQAKLQVIRAYKSQHFRYDYENLFSALTRVHGLATKSKLAEAFETVYQIIGQGEE